nr:testis specific protein A14 [Tetraodon nigroviridis]
MSFSRSIGSAQYTDIRFPRNPKYAHIKRKLDTDYRYQRDEIFNRLKVQTFAQLTSFHFLHSFVNFFKQILQVSSKSDPSESDENESQVTEESLSVTSDGGRQSQSAESSQASTSLCSPHVEDADSCSTTRSRLISVINGVGEMNLKDHQLENEAVVKPTPPEKPCPNCPYLLLDLRDREDFDRCHIISAQSFPSVMLLRTMNPFTKEILEYKNAPGKIIVIYDEDERIAIQAATAMCQRGVENLFVLSGGLKVVAQNFPEGMTTGTLPPSCWPSPPSRRRKGSQRRQQQQQQQLQAAETRCRFTEEELAKIQEQLDKLLPYSSENITLTSALSSCLPPAGRSHVCSRDQPRSSEDTLEMKALAPVPNVHKTSFLKSSLQTKP